MNVPSDPAYMRILTTEGIRYAFIAGVEVTLTGTIDESDLPEKCAIYEQNDHGLFRPYVKTEAV